ncbi:hypothetical protein ALC62_04329 [Cyphomyrmex costatus]|uniref:Uncharacterized protein n=1 Tax=Cyphomyrmex costatus TaxID=456900 RepID=A0A151IKE6_9HYME|nr:hypothetical protein ALC62_04329 [Cyphomyrmex costatus]
MSGVYNRTGQNAIGESGVDLAPSERSIVLAITTTTHVHEPLFQHCSRTHESRDPRHRGLSMPDGETRTLGATLEALDTLVAPLQPRETLAQYSYATAMFEQFAFRTLVVFHFRNKKLFGALARYSFARFATSLHVYNVIESDHLFIVEEGRYTLSAPTVVLSTPVTK